MPCVSILVVLADILAIKADDGQTEDKLQEPHARDEHTHQLGALADGLGISLILDVCARSDVGRIVGHLDWRLGAVVGWVAGLLELLGLLCLFFGVMVLFGFREAEFDQGYDEEGHFV